MSAPRRLRFGIRAVMAAMAIVGVAIVATRLAHEAYQAKRQANLQGLGSGGAILVADGEVVLIRQGNAYGAISFDQQTARENADFTWRYREDGLGSLASTEPAVRMGGGHTSTHGGTIVRFGPFAIEWSECGDGYGWLYHDRDRPPYLLCPAGVRSFERLDASDAKWRYNGRPQAEPQPSPRGMAP